MTGKELFEIWAEKGSEWTEWVRPVAFVAIDLYSAPAITNFDIPKVNYINRLQPDTAIILDLPGNDSVKESFALANLGWRPIPLYDGTNAQNGVMSNIDSLSIGAALISGAQLIQKLKIKSNAPPVFLLDSYRTHRFKIDTSEFDNSWDLFDYYLPSPEYLLEHGISRIILRAEKVQKDINNILYQFQKKGICIYFTKGYKEPKKVNLKKSRFC